MNILFLDTETTDKDSTARLVQLAYKHFPSKKVVNKLFKPPVPISFGAMAVSHITNEMVQEEIPFELSEERNELNAFVNDHIIVAHNAPFDIRILNNEGIQIPLYIDSLRVAQHLIESESHALQYLRYSQGIYKDLENESITAHDAFGDILVLEKLFFLLFEKVKSGFDIQDDRQILEKMLELSTTPLLLKEFAFGKYKGMSYQEVSETDRGYLDWLYKSEASKEPSEQNENLLFTLRHYLSRS